MIEVGLGNIVGEQYVLTNPEILGGYSGKPGGKKPECVVQPAAIDEVQKIVRWANEYQVPLVPVSSGPPHFRGDSDPEVEGAVIIDMTRMNKIIRVNAANRVAILRKVESDP